MAEAQQQSYQVTGMHCASCAHIIEKKIKKIPGVLDISVNVATDAATIKTARKIDITTLNHSIEPYGYQLATTTSVTSSTSKAINPPFIVAAIAFLFMLWETAFGFHLFGIPKPPGSMWDHHAFLAALASINLWVFGGQFIKAIPRFVKTGHANMDTLVGLGTVIAYLYSLASLLGSSWLKSMQLPEVFAFDVTAVVIGFVLFGKQLEAQSKKQTHQAIEALMAIQVKTALVIKDKQQLEIPIDQLAVGDICLVKPGATIPADGHVIEGSSAVDESMITGESLPVDKTTHDAVIGGTINANGALTISIDQVGQQTTLARIIVQVKAAEQTRAPIEHLADTIAAWFVPVVLIISLGTGIVWFIVGDTSQAVAGLIGVLVIACPCALGLATPTAMVTAIGRGANQGMLIKDAAALQRLASITALVIDKTGTLTQGKPSVEKVVELEGKSDQICSIAAALEQNSSHPIAKAVVDEAHRRSLQLNKVIDFKDLTGKGVCGKIGGKLYYVGSEKLMNELGIAVGNEKDNYSQVYVSQTGNKLLGYILVADVIKPAAADAIKQLQSLSLEVVLATGDNQTVAQTIAKQAGISHVHADLLPEDKLQLIAQLKQQGKHVGMMGDGINDTPALAAADVGIAVSTGSDAAIATADIAILHGDLMKATKAIKLAKTTMRIVRQNLFWASIYNVVGIPLAAGWLKPVFGIVLDPMYAGVAMALSSVSVVTNSLRLRKARL